MECALILVLAVFFRRPNLDLDSLESLVSVSSGGVKIPFASSSAGHAVSFYSYTRYNNIPFFSLASLAALIARN